MATLTIRNVDESLKEALRVQAALSGRSMEEELRQILKRALLQARATQGLGSAVSRRFAAIGGVELPLAARSEPRTLPLLAQESGHPKPLRGYRRRRPASEG